MYAACAAPLLRLVGANNFVLSMAGETSTGKTTTLQVAASVFGNPVKDAADTIVHSWDATAVFRERAPAVQADLPFSVDETQRAKGGGADVQQTVYDLAHGQGRGRGSQKGLAGRDNFRTVALTTGEKPVVSFSEAGGTRSRVMELWGSPFDAQTQELTAVTWELVHGVEEHFGHAGLAYARFLVENSTRWPAWKAEFRDLVFHFQGKAAGNAVAGRLAESFAVITLAARLLHQSVALPWEYEDPVEPLYDELVSEVKEVDRAAAALRYVVAWADARPKDFLVLDGRDWNRQPPASGWAGARPPGPAPQPSSKPSSTPASKPAAKSSPPKPPRAKKQFALAFYGHRLTKILAEGGFDAEAVKRSWKQKAWLVCDSEKRADRFELSIRLWDKKTRMVAITAAGIAAAQAG